MQVVEVVGAYRDVGLPEAVFAAAVPKNYEKQMRDLLAEVIADHEATVRCFEHHLFGTMMNNGNYFLCLCHKLEELQEISFHLLEPQVPYFRRKPVREFGAMLSMFQLDTTVQTCL
jgi:hypothetical protein